MPLSVPVQFCQTQLMDVECTEVAPETISYGRKLLCQKCGEGFFLNRQRARCLPQPPLITNCSRMDKEFDRCLECQEGFFLEAESTKCRANPAGIVACASYQDEFTCVECEDFYYPLHG